MYTNWAYSIPTSVLALLHRYTRSTSTRAQETSTGGQQSYNHNQERQPTFVSTQYNHTIMYKSSPLNVYYRSLPHLPHGPISSATLASAVLPNSLTHPIPNPSYLHWTIQLPIAIQSTPADYSVPMHHQMLPNYNERQFRVPAHYTLRSFGEALPSTRL